MKKDKKQKYLCSYCGWDTWTMVEGQPMCVKCKAIYSFIKMEKFIPPNHNEK